MLENIQLTNKEILFITCDLLNNRSTNNIFSNYINKKRYHEIQNNFKRYAKENIKFTKTLRSSIKRFNNYDEINIRDRYYYYKTEVLNYEYIIKKKLKFLLKNCDRKILDPVAFPCLKYYPYKSFNVIYQYKFNKDNRNINAIFVNFCKYMEGDKELYKIYLEFKVSSKNKKHVQNNLNSLVYILNKCFKYNNN